MTPGNQLYLFHMVRKYEDEGWRFQPVGDGIDIYYPDDFLRRYRMVDMARVWIFGDLTAAAAFITGVQQLAEIQRIAAHEGGAS